MIGRREGLVSILPQRGVLVQASGSKGQWVARLHVQLAAGWLSRGMVREIACMHAELCASLLLMTRS